MARNYPRLNIEDFGAHLLKSGDLDPIYIALHRAKFETGQLYRWLIAYWCYYHAGVASFLSEKEGPDFWRWMNIAAENAPEAPTPFGARWPRGHERRHYRAAIATSSVAYLRSRYPEPESMVRYLASAADPAPLPFRTVSSRAQEWRGFGPWIGFKIADMVDRCLGDAVNFSTDDVMMFKDPEEAALKLWKMRQGFPESAVPKDKRAAIETVTAYLIDHFKGFSAPPLGDRPVNIQEVETILCKWKSHMNGHYPLNNDIIEIGDGLTPWTSDCHAASLFKAALNLSTLPLKEL